MKRALAVAVALSLLVATAGVVWWFAFLPGQRAKETVQAIAAGLASGTLDDALFVTPAAGAELSRIYSGMGALRPQVTPGEVRTLPDGSLGTDLTWRWEIHAGKAPWEYTTPIALVRADGPNWKATFSPALVAPGLERTDRLRATRLSAVRGAILGQDGEPLAGNTQAFRVGIDKTLTTPESAAASARPVAELLGIDPDRYVARVQGAGAKAFIEARILRANDPTESALATRASEWAGVRAIRTTFPLGLTSSFARPLLGVVGEATAEQVEASAGTIRAGDLAGRGGLQEARNHVLAGLTGFVIERVDPDNKAAELFRVEPLNGTDVQTTIDVGLQRSAEQILAGVGPASSLVAIRPSDGAVLAAAVGPGSQGFSTATMGQYAPGSTFKVVTSLAMARHGITPDTTVECSDGITVDGYRFDNWQGYPAGALGSVPLRTAFAFSCNSAFINARGTVSQADLADAAGSLGLTAEPQLVLPGFLGAVPTEAAGVDHAASMIGQGKLLASPLGMATVAASVAAGHTVVPVLVPEPGRTPESTAAPLTEAEAAQLRTLMRAVVTEGGHASLAALPGEPVLAKTGTASHGAQVRFHGWMIAVQGDLAVAAFTEDATSGTADAEPLVVSLLQAAARR
ncbi:penicillin-binding protein [Propioniciclava coleopterorum]|uniref:Beta-lactamase n=1 Tax=Propioniciclava coleopterorum TaxID=2714937 RepID=A0A6G7Y3Z7_9ACTN|nr:penicillin-binding transpeptidase domain-containing protein [Propioniciclava coleopterorum]QIK71368.1 penicillin-binding protein [Propioniciclava coleopterorum]